MTDRQSTIIENLQNGSSLQVHGPDDSSVAINVVAQGANAHLRGGTMFPEQGTTASIQTTRYAAPVGRDDYGQPIAYGTRRSVGVEGQDVVIRSAPMQQPYDYGGSVYYGHNGLREGANELRIQSPEVAALLDTAIRTALRDGLTAPEARDLERLRETVARHGADDGRYDAEEIAQIATQAGQMRSGDRQR